jgi:hypothetical protein
MAFTESVPAAEHVPGFLEHVYGKDVCVGAAPATLESLEFAEQIRSAQLSQSILVAAAIG